MSYLYDIERVSETQLLLRFQDNPSHALSLYLRYVMSGLNAYFGNKLQSIVPGFNTLLLSFNDGLVELSSIRQTLVSLNQQYSKNINHTSQSITHQVPVYYHPEVAPDLISLSQTTGLSVDEVIERHFTRRYFVYAIGFMPGFAYMGDIDPRLSVPRLATPRIKVPKGSVAITEQQTAIYPYESPGGWHILGRCPKPLLIRQAGKFEGMNVGDTVIFEPINLEKFIALGGCLTP